MPFDVLIFIGWIFWGAALVGCMYLLHAGHAVRRFAARPRPERANSEAVSVLKPLCGEDPGLYENLRSICCQRYPRWQVVFGVQDPQDPAIAVVRRLIAEFPEADLSLVVNGFRHGGNLKVANLQNMLPAARHDLILIADSDMRVDASYLAAVTAPLSDPTVGLVTCLYRGLASGGPWSELAASHINHGFLPQAIVAQALGAGAGCFGATLALRRATLEAVGGLAAIADELADDHALGTAVRAKGLKVVLSSYIVDNIIAEPSLGALFRHELRWARTIRMIAPLGFIGSVITQPLVLGALAAGLGVPAVPALAVLGAALVSRSIMVMTIDRELRLAPTPLWRMPARDMLSFAVFVASFFTRRVAWRDRIFRIGRNGRVMLDGDKPA